MARLEREGCQERRYWVYHLLQHHRFRLRASEIAIETGLHRCTVNDCLRELQVDKKAWKDGRLWYARR